MTLSENKYYVLHTEKVRGKWWLKLTEKATGLTWLTLWNTKAQAIAIFRGMTFTDIIEAIEKDFKVKPTQIYKAGLKWGLA